MKIKDQKISLTIADYITLSNALLGFLAITYIIDRRFRIASALIVFILGMDGIDGVVARKLNIEHKQGAYLDLFSDTISFCFAPSILLYSNFYEIALGRAWESPVNLLSTAVPMVIVFFGILRLARFTEGSSGVSYKGLPTPIIALTIISMTLLFGHGELIGYHPIFAMISIFTASVLMYTEIRYPKIRGKLITILSGLFVLISLLGVILFNYYTLISTIFIGISLIGCIIYILAGPLIVKLW